MRPRGERRHRGALRDGRYLVHTGLKQTQCATSASRMQYDLDSPQSLSLVHASIAVWQKNPTEPAFNPVWQFDAISSPEGEQ